MGRLDQCIPMDTLKVYFQFSYLVFGIFCLNLPILENNFWKGAESLIKIKSLNVGISIFKNIIQS